MNKVHYWWSFDVLIFTFITSIEVASVKAAEGQAVIVLEIDIVNCQNYSPVTKCVMFYI